MWVLTSDDRLDILRSTSVQPTHQIPQVRSLVPGNRVASQLALFGKPKEGADAWIVEARVEMGERKMLLPAITQTEEAFLLRLIENHQPLVQTLNRRVLIADLPT